MLKNKSLFITGTDTNIGKTTTTAILLNYFSQLGLPVGYFKPVLSGVIEGDETLKIAELVSNKNIEIQSSYKFLAPISPHLASKNEGVNIDTTKIINDWLGLDKNKIWFVEGAGGAAVPLTDDYNISNLILDLNLPTLVVARTSLGTINHTVLTIKYLLGQGIEVKGIILSGKPEKQIKDTLQKQTGCPVVLEIPDLDEVSQASVFKFSMDMDKEFAHSLMEKPLLKESLASKDQKNIWHPFTQHKWGNQNLIVSQAKGSYLKIGDQWVIDGISSWWTNLHGHSHPEIAEAIAKQSKKLDHVIFANYSHEPAIRLSEELIALSTSCGQKVDKVFFSDNGSTAVEVALKMAFQAQSQRGKNKKKFLALKNSYHGDTLGAMSVGDPEGYHAIFKPLMCEVDFVDPKDLMTLSQRLEGSGEDYAAVIVEPILQGAGGMQIYSPEFLEKLSEFKNRYGFFIIADEVFTGFYRTGNFLASQLAKNFQPDFICLSKGITGGFLPLSVTLTTNEIFECFLDDNVKWAFLHGHSYTGNPISCAAALKSLEILKRQETQSQIALISEITQQQIEALANHELVKNPRSLGTLGAFDIKGSEGYFQGNLAHKIAKAALESGVLIRPLGGTIYTLPPYCTSEKDLIHIYQVIQQILKDILRGEFK